MDSKDLRIGNIYKTNVEFIGSLEAKINVFKDKSFFVLTEKNLILILQFNLLAFIEPIKLTTEILEQIAIPYEWKLFNYDHYIIKSSIDVFIRVISDIEIVIFTQNPCDIHTKNYICKVGSLHTLQNVYQMLTSNELPININTLKV